jgi:hypothetical protein
METEERLALAKGVFTENRPRPLARYIRLRRRKMVGEKGKKSHAGFEGKLA